MAAGHHRRRRQQTTNGQLAVLLRSAVDVLDFAVRDTGLLRSVLPRMPVMAQIHRNGVALALAALGGPVLCEDVITGRSDRDGCEVHVLALILSPMSHEEKRKRLRELRNFAAFALHPSIDEMIEPMDAGATIGVVM